MELQDRAGAASELVALAEKIGSVFPNQIFAQS